MTIEKKLLGTSPVSGEVLPEAVSFDGTSDYLTRSSNMTGNANSKTFTFSCWIYPTKTAMMVFIGGASRFKVFHDGANFRFFAYQPTPSSSIAFSFSIAGIPLNTFSHVLCSIDLANTSNRYVYVNDIAQTVTWSTYNNSLADFSQSVYYIIKDGGSYDGGRLAHFFLDYTYRDLSVTANRRLFITADGKPSSTIPSSPILYLPMKDAATAGVNSGTGGNFTVNGLLATAQRGPNQDNCSASTFDGSNDYLSKTSLQGATDTKTLTINANVMSNSGVVLSNTNGSAYTVQMSVDQSNGVNIVCRNASNTDILNWYYKVSSPVADGTQLSIQVSVDLADTSKKHFYVNGVASTGSTITYTNDAIDFTVNQWDIGRRGDAGNNYFNGSMGEVYINNTYTDLATSNPFWDSDANRPNSVRKVIADTSVTPLIALPIIGNDAGNNLGSGGDFTVNSGPFTGARGGSEFWVSSLVGVSPANYVSLNATQAVLPYTDGKQFTIFGMMRQVTSDNNKDFQIEDRVNLFNYFGSANNPNSRINLYNSSGAEIYKREWAANTLGLGAWYILMFSVDLTDSAKDIYMYNQVDAPSATVFTNNEIGTSSALSTIIAPTSSASRAFAGYYITDSYTDFKQESVRNKFVDQLGYPRDLTQQIEDGDIATPIIYMKFDDLSALGTNSGSGANFTVTGTGSNGPSYNP